jgi:diphthine synthase
MTVNEGLQYLLKIESKRKEKIISEEKFAIGCARIGSSDYKIKYGKVKDLIKQDFGNAPHCIIIPGKLHFAEEEALEMYK